MRTIGFSGKSGTGKSYRALSVAAENKINLIIDDGLLICNGKVLAGKSAKKERHPYASTLRAIFNDEEHAKEVAEAIKKSGEKSILVLGTSEKMVNLISERVGVSPVERHIHIEDVATREEIETANTMRAKYGKHVIPVPTFEIKRTFSGYMLDPLTSIKKLADGFFDKSNPERTIVRPAYGYRGNFDISEKVLCQIAKYEASRIEGVDRVGKVYYYEENGRGAFSIDLSIEYGKIIPELCSHIQKKISTAIDESASIYIDTIDITITDVVLIKDIDTLLQ